MTRVARTMRRGMGALRRLVSGGVLVAVLASLMCLGALPHPADSNAATLATNAGLGIATAAFPDGVVGMAYSQIIEATGGTPPYTWLVVGGVFPAGLDISYGVVTGIPTTAGRFAFDMRVTDSLGDKATAMDSWAMAPPTTATHPSW
jgi:hypothetical protein